MNISIFLTRKPLSLRYRYYIVIIAIVLYVCAYALFHLLGQIEQLGLQNISRLPDGVEHLTSIYGFLGFFCIIFPTFSYLYNSFIAKRFIAIQLPRVLAYMGIGGLIATVAEYLVNAVAHAVVHEPIYLYHIAPVHHGYTSIIMFAFWPIYCFHLYLFHTALAIHSRKKWGDDILAMMLGIDGIMMECFVNLVTFLFFAANIFYYPANDLLHFSSFMIIPVYCFIGFLGLNAVHIVEKQKYPTLIALLGFAANAVFIFAGS